MPPPHATCGAEQSSHPHASVVQSRAEQSRAGWGTLKPKPKPKGGMTKSWAPMPPPRPPMGGRSGVGDTIRNLRCRARPGLLLIPPRIQRGPQRGHPPPRLLPPLTRPGGRVRACRPLPCVNRTYHQPPLFIFGNPTTQVRWGVDQGEGVHLNPNPEGRAGRDVI